MKKITYINLIALLFIVSSCVNEDKVNQERSGSAGQPRLDVKVVDESGNAVAGATVDFFTNSSDYANETNAIKSATTDADGIASLEPGDVSDERGAYYFSAASGNTRNWASTVVSPYLYWSSGPTTIETTVAGVLTQFLDLNTGTYIMTRYEYPDGSNGQYKACEDDDTFIFRKDGKLIRAEGATSCATVTPDQAPVSVAGEIWSDWSLNADGTKITLRDLDPAWEYGTDPDAGLSISGGTVTIDYGGGYIATLVRQ